MLFNGCNCNNVGSRCFVVGIECFLPLTSVVDSVSISCAAVYNEHIIKAVDKKYDFSMGKNSIVIRKNTRIAIKLMLIG